MLRRTAVVILAILGLMGLSIAATQVATSPARYTSPASGQEMYVSYCASCHGVDGKGGGPAAAAMKNAMPDLTRLAVAHEGKFPFERVIQMIRGDVNSPSHGSQDMPVWGPVFLKMSQHQPAEVHQRVQNLAKYIEGMQTK